MYIIYMYIAVLVIDNYYAHSTIFYEYDALAVYYNIYIYNVMYKMCRTRCVCVCVCGLS